VSGSVADGEENASRSYSTPATPTKKWNESSGHASQSRPVPRRAADGGDDDAAQDAKISDEDFSLGTPKKRSLETGGALTASAWETNGDATETEIEPETEDDEGEERTRVDIVSSSMLRRAGAMVDRQRDEELSKLVSSPMPRALSESVEMERTLSREMSEKRGVNTPEKVNEDNNGVSSGCPKTPWTATPDASMPIGLKPADRAIGRELFQNISMSPHGAKESYASPRVMQTADSNLEYEKVATEMMETLGDECEEVCLMLEYALGLRDKWLFDDSKGACPIVGTPDKAAPLPAKSQHECRMVDGVMHVYHPNAQGESELVHEPPGTATDFFYDLHALLRVQSYGPSKTFCHKRLMLTEQKFHLHVMLNADREFLEQKKAPHRDFYNVRKVDTHVHHSACMNQKHLLRFIKSKLKREPQEIVIYRDGKFLNLREVFESIGMTAYELNVDTLDMHADKNTFHRFDKFNLKYNPMGQSRLREIFIKQDNLIRGRFLAELTKQVCSDLEANKYTMAEYRISIYGRKPGEWDNLAAWVLNHNVFSENMVWMIQIPRLYNVYHSNGTMKNFQQMLDNIFKPLFEVTVDPSSHPKLHTFLQMVVGVDMVDDESKPERRPSKHMRVPVDWDVSHNPAYAYYAYYVYANLYTLNALRVSKGLNTIAFRPHAGEAGDIDHLCATFMLAKNIAHGLNLRKSPCMQYLYFLTQIPLDMSPLSNNSLFIDYHKNPFPTFFARGLRVSLSTDDPLMIHMTKEPLVEEYSVAAQVWKLSAADLCEIAKTSVLNSGFPIASKMHWVSDQYWLSGTRGNDIQKTNVPDLRAHFRADVLECEKTLVRRGVVQARQKGREVKIRG
jgi:AMP deaminase